MKKTILKRFRQLFGKKSISENERLQQLRDEIGITFLNWAEEFFCKENLNRLLMIENVLEDYNNNPDTSKNITIGWFKSKLRLYCAYRGHLYNPLYHCTTETGRIIRYNIQDGKSKEFIFIESQNEKA